MGRVQQPFDELGRVLALQDHRILDTPPEEAFDNVTALCSQLLDVPIAFGRIAALAHGGRLWLEDAQPRGGRCVLEVPRGEDSSS